MIYVARANTRFTLSLPFVSVSIETYASFGALLYLQLTRTRDHTYTHTYLLPHAAGDVQMQRCKAQIGEAVDKPRVHDCLHNYQRTTRNKSKGTKPFHGGAVVIFTSVRAVGFRVIAFRNVCCITVRGTMTLLTFLLFGSTLCLIRANFYFIFFFCHQYLRNCRIRTVPR